MSKTMIGPLQLLKQVMDVRIDVSRGELETEIDGIKIHTEFLTHFGFQNRSSRHLLLMNGILVGFYEEYTPWNIFKESRVSIHLNIDSIKKHGKDWVEEPYSDTPMYYPCVGTIEEALKYVRKYEMLTKGVELRQTQLQEARDSVRPFNKQ